MFYVAAIIILGTLACMGFGIFLIATSRRRGGSGPRCGHCQYNLTGNVSGRCPECGKLLIEAGVLTRTSRSRGRMWLGIVLLVAPLIPTSLGFATTMFYRARTARQAAAAEKARAAAVTNFIQNILQSTSAPASRASP